MPTLIALFQFFTCIGHYLMIPMMNITNKFISYQILMVEGLFRFFKFEVLSFCVLAVLSL